MNDSVQRLRKIIVASRARDSLKKFANMCEEAEYENDIKEFNNKVATAFQEARTGFSAEGLQMEKIERDYDPGFSVLDSPDSRFIFWIELHGRRPVAKARRKADSLPGASVVSTPELCSTKPCDIRNVSPENIMNAIVYAYEKSFFQT